MCEASQVVGSFQPRAISPRAISPRAMKPRAMQPRAMQSRAMQSRTHPVTKNTYADRRLGEADD